MTWKYSQREGVLIQGEDIIAHGYAGHGEGKNNPDMQDVAKVGPLPVGLYVIRAPYDSAKVGPYALPLEPDADNEMFDRSAFRIHGDSIQHPGEASLGCIVLPKAVRVAIWESGDHQLQVVREMV